MFERCIVIGAGHAAAEFVINLRNKGWQGEVHIIGDEPHLPYRRPPLSKAFLQTDQSVDDILIRPAALYQKLNITFHRGMRVQTIHRMSRTVVTDSGAVLEYSKLAILSGAKARRLSVEGSNKKGIFYLRTACDVMQIRSALANVQNVVIVGGGYIGLETAASLNKMGFKVTVLEAMGRVLERVTAPEVSEFFSRVHSEEGVDIRPCSVVRKIEGGATVSHVLCENGDRIAADAVVVGIGVVPDTQLAEAAGLHVDNGIVIDDFAYTSDKNIVAAGDCANQFNEVYQRRMRMESVPNAMNQAQVAAASLCGERQRSRFLPWFWSDQYDLKLQIAGVSQGYDRVLIRGDICNSRSFSAFYFKEQQLIAVDCVNRPQEFMLAKRSIDSRNTLDIANIVNDDINPKLILVG